MSKNLNLNQTVRYIRITPEGEPARGEGKIVGHIIGITGRENYMVKDSGKAYNLEPFALEATPEEEEQYIAHVKKIRAAAEDYNKRSQDVITEGNLAIDKMNNEFFGEPLVL